MRLIDADALMQAIANTATNTVYKAYETGTHTFTEALDRLGELSKEIVGMIAKAPVINPEDLIPHGRWRYTATGGVVSLNGYCCSVCYEQFFRKPYNYCPNCGAKMDGEKDGCS